MSIIIIVLRILAVILMTVLQQGFLIVLGFLSYSKGHIGGAIFVWLLCIPMIYINVLTYKYLMKFGLIDFHSAASDTSELDIPKGKRWYDE